MGIKRLEEEGRKLQDQYDEAVVKIFDVTKGMNEYSAPPDRYALLCASCMRTQAVAICQYQ